MAILVTALTSVLFFLVSLGALIVTGVTLHRFRHYENDPNDPIYYSQNPSKGQVTPQAYVPVGGIVPGILEGQVAIGALGLVTSLAALVDIGVQLRRRGAVGGKRVIPVVLLSMVAIAGVFGWVFHEYANEATMSIGFSQQGYFGVGWDSDTDETGVSWLEYTCSLQPWMAQTSLYGTWWGTSCHLNKASKWITVPVLVLAVLMAAAEMFAAAFSKGDGSSRRVVKHGEPMELDEYGNRRS